MVGDYICSDVFHARPRFQIVSIFHGPALADFANGLFEFSDTRAKKRNTGAMLFVRIACFIHRAGHRVANIVQLVDKIAAARLARKLHAPAAFLAKYAGCLNQHRMFLFQALQDLPLPEVIQIGSNHLPDFTRAIWGVSKSWNFRHGLSPKIGICQRGQSHQRRWNYERLPP